MKIELAIREWARRDPRAAQRLRRADNRRMEYMRSLFGAFCPDEGDVEVRCVLLLSLWVGNHLIAADHGTRSRADVLDGRCDGSRRNRRSQLVLCRPDTKPAEPAWSPTATR